MVKSADPAKAFVSVVLLPDVPLATSRATPVAGASDATVPEPERLAEILATGVGFTLICSSEAFAEAFARVSVEVVATAVIVDPVTSVVQGEMVASQIGLSDRPATILS